MNYHKTCFVLNISISSIRFNFIQSIPITFRTFLFIIHIFCDVIFNNWLQQLLHLNLISDAFLLLLFTQVLLYKGRLYSKQVSLQTFHEKCMLTYMKIVSNASQNPSCALLRRYGDFSTISRPQNSAYKAYQEARNLKRDSTKLNRNIPFIITYNNQFESVCTSKR